MGSLLAVVAGGVFDQFLAELLIAPTIAGAAAIALRDRHRAPQAVGAVVSWVVATVAVALAAGGGPADAGSAVVEGPRRLLTTEWPSPVEPSVVASVGLLLGVATGIATTLATRARWRLAPLVPLAVAAIVVIALSAPVHPPWWSIVGVGVGALVLGLFPSDETVGGRARTLVGDRTLTIGVAAVFAVAIATASGVAIADRADPRAVEDAELSVTALDPIEATVALRLADPPIALLEITDRSTLVGRALPSRWRLAALDVYDGQRWVPRIELRPIGERLGRAPPIEPGEAPPITYDVEYRTDDLDLVPLPGAPLSVGAPVTTDLDRVAVRLRDTPGPGTSITVEAEIAPTLASVTERPTNPFLARPVDEIAQTFTDQARNLGGDETDSVLGQLRAIEATMRTEWVLDRDAPGGGQQLALLERFVAETRRGTHEQFVTAFVLLVRSLGVDARVAIGFEVPPEQLASPITVRSTDASSWPEVHIAESGTDDGGWVAFDPVPSREDTVEEDPPEAPDAQSPAAAQPPIEPPADDLDDRDDGEVSSTVTADRWATLRTWARRVGVVSSFTLLPVLLAVAAIVAVKWRRRRRRLRHPDPAHRIRGAWANVTDALVDAGLTVRPAWTDDRIAVHGGPLAPTVPHELRRLAAMATAITFGPTDDAWRLADDAASTSRSVRDALGAGRTRWERLRWRLSLRSLRRRTRSPVVP